MVDLSKIRNSPDKRKFKPKKYRAYDLEGAGESTTNAPSTVDTSVVSPAVSSENAHLPAPTTNLQQIYEISPDECEPWQFADRDDAEMGDIEELSNSIKSNGQQEPALVRPISDISSRTPIKYEVIFGHRRWLACKLANKRFLVMIKPLNDREAAVAQKEENENRQNLSPYSKALHYKKLLTEQVFSSERELAANLNLSKSTLNLLMSFTRIPAILCKAIGSMHDLPIRTAEKLASLSKNMSDEDLQGLCRIAKDIASGKIPFNKIEYALQRNDKQLKNLTKQEKIIFKNKYGVQLFTSGLNQNKAHCFTFHKVIRDNNLISDLESIIHEFLCKKLDNNES